MPQAFVLIKSEIGAEDELRDELKKIEHVEVHSVYGVYDIVIKVEEDTLGKLKDVVHRRIRHLDKIRSTLTMIVMGNKK